MFSDACVVWRGMFERLIGRKDAMSPKKRELEHRFQGSQVKGGRGDAECLFLYWELNLGS